MSEDRVVMWGDKRLEDMTREELIEAIQILALEARDRHTPAASMERALGRIEMLKRGNVALHADAAHAKYLDWLYMNR